MPAREARTPLSSSTIRMDSRMRYLERPSGAPSSCGQLHHEPRPPRLVVLDSDRPVMLLHDAAHDGQAEPASPPLGGEVGDEQAFPVFGNDPWPVVGHGEAGPSLGPVEL